MPSEGHFKAYFKGDFKPVLANVVFSTIIQNRAVSKKVSMYVQCVLKKYTLKQIVKLKNFSEMSEMYFPTYLV